MFVKKFSTTAVLPVRATAGSGGYDLAADLPAPVVIEPGQSLLIPTGIGFALPEGAVGLVFGRSGLGAHHGIVPANAVGVIDWDYRGEIRVPLRNQSAVPFTVRPGDRIAQMVVVPVLTPPLELTEDLGSSARGEQGFGSTGLAAKEG